MKRLLSLINALFMLTSCVNNHYFSLQEGNYACKELDYYMYGVKMPDEYEGDDYLFCSLEIKEVDENIYQNSDNYKENLIKDLSNKFYVINFTYNNENVTNNYNFYQLSIIEKNDNYIKYSDKFLSTIEFYQNDDNTISINIKYNYFSLTYDKEVSLEALKNSLSEDDYNLSLNTYYCFFF